ncbi:MAG: hypothetical protein KKA67_03080, partial [Spirochaetes bacterium]|nr:hypothetical protein [Spirochaetota bacterium]
MERIGRALARRETVAVAAILLAAFAAFGMPRMRALMEEHTPAGGSFDTEFFYTPAQASDKASLYGDAQAAASVRAHWTYDLAFPLCYGFFSASAWAFGLSLLASGSRGPRFGLLLVPIAGSAFDLCENAAVSLFLAADPSGPAAGLLAAAASAGTALKWLFVMPAFAGA